MDPMRCVSRGEGSVTGSGSPSIGKAFCDNPALTKLGFRGTTAVGWIPLRQAAERVVTCSMELGVNPPPLVFDDADGETAVAGAMANDTEIGLASSPFARDIGRVTRVSEALQYGILGVNSGLISAESAPFGGVKQSGLGREGGREGIEDYLEAKDTCAAM